MQTKQQGKFIFIHNNKEVEVFTSNPDFFGRNIDFYTAIGKKLRHIYYYNDQWLWDKQPKSYEDEGNYEPFPYEVKSFRYWLEVMK